MGDAEQQVEARKRERGLGRPDAPVVSWQLSEHSQDKPDCARGEQHIGHLAQDTGGERGAAGKMASEFEQGYSQHWIAQD